MGQHGLANWIDIKLASNHWWQSHLCDWAILVAVAAVDAAALAADDGYRLRGGNAAAGLDNLSFSILPRAWCKRALVAWHR